MRPDDPADAVTRVLMRLDDAAIGYMITGSVAGLFYGLNRSTVDTDIVIDLRPRSVGAFVAAFRDGYFVDPRMVEESARTRIMFNIMPFEGGKFDLIPLKDTPFERARFARRVVQDWHDYPAWVSTAPDLVLAKLEWARESHSARQFADIRAIMSSDAFDEDDAYFRRWLRALGLEETLDACRAAGYDE